MADIALDDAALLLGDDAAVADRAEPPKLFRRWSTGDLLDADRTFRWRARGLLVDPTYGIVGGERKTLKTYVDIIKNVGIATGARIFDHFDVDQPAPVVAYVGEGGRAPYTRRLERIATAMGVRLRDAPLFVSFDVAPVGSVIFQESLRRDLDELRPGLVALDPLYAFHGSKTNASNLYDEGELLTSMSTPCLDAGATLNIVTHFNKTGTGRGLDRITQAGAQEWADSWLLLAHRETPDVERGRFRLLMEVGSRQWGGSTWELDLDVGRFDPEMGDFDGAITWDLRRYTADQAATDLGESILEVLGDLPWKLTKTEVLERVGGNRQESGRAFQDLSRRGEIASETLPHVEGGRSVRRALWGRRVQPVPVAGTGWNGLDS